MANNRVGHCTSCGDCCRLPKPCSFLRYNDDKTSYCAIYQVRPMSCRKYPRTQAEFITPINCGFSFDKQSEAPTLANLTDSAKQTIVNADD